MPEQFYDETMARQQEALAATPDKKRDRDLLLEKLSPSTGESILDIGSGNGIFCREILEYMGGKGRVVGLDYAEPMIWLATALCPEAEFHFGSATDLPFEEGSFDAATGAQVLCFVDDQAAAVGEMFRVLKPGGYVFFTATWQCGPWLAEGYPVRPFADFDWKGKLTKLSVPIRNSVAFRAMHVFPKRAWSLLREAVSPGPQPLRYTKLHPTYEKNWLPDATAECSVEPFSVYMWFTTRGAKCLNYPTRRSAFLIRTGHMTFRKPGASNETDS